MLLQGWSGRWVRIVRAALVHLRQAAVLVALAGTFGALTGCAGVGGRISADAPAEKKVELVSVRATERWKALIAGNMEQAYGFLSPASRQVTSFDQYKARVNPRMFRKAEIESVRCEAEVCTVRMLVTYDHRLMKGITTPLEEAWILENGRYWYVYRG